MYFDRRHFLSSLTGATSALMLDTDPLGNLAFAKNSLSQPNIRITDIKTYDAASRLGLAASLDVSSG